MNLGRTVFNNSLIPVLKEVDPFWLLGFIEAEGTFGLKKKKNKIKSFFKR